MCIQNFKRLRQVVVEICIFWVVYGVNMYCTVSFYSIFLVLFLICSSIATRQVYTMSCTIRVTPFPCFPCIPVHSRSFSVILSCSRYFPSPCYHVPYLSPLLFHISILCSGRDELDQQTEFSARSDYILSFYCLCLRIPPCHSVNPVLIVYLHISLLGSSYCPPPYISPHKL